MKLTEEEIGAAQKAIDNLVFYELDEFLADVVAHEEEQEARIAEEARKKEAEQAPGRHPLQSIRDAGGDIEKMSREEIYEVYMWMNDAAAVFRGIYFKHAFDEDEEYGNKSDMDGAMLTAKPL